ncbi:MAG: hypothetical protein JW984_11265 [Deltaproteobacteria bacterium]|uniref:Uncharacterized protein n=1 Tax=Candidatus Zymogenus saltonus TaxID=2844893 RepID=A0A9D8KGJ0_9DELT|nr:hypothetical protein [Candidatus Zymogenus saltonus]
MGLISLCHPDEKKSCGACCGLYNWEDNSRETLTKLMGKRREAYLKAGGGCGVGREGVDLDIMARELDKIDTPRVLFDVIHNCPFVGFVDDGGNRVGCMIHPVNNGGVELRDVSFYGAELCSGHECPSYRVLTEREVRAVSAVIDDWYLYGLVITDIDLVKEFFTITANRIGEEIDPGRLDRPAVKEACLNFFRLKETWPFSNGRGRFGKYSFSEAEYRIEREVAKGGLNISQSPYFKIFLSLATDFKTEGEAKEADRIVDGILTDFIRAYREAPLKVDSGEAPLSAGGGGGRSR